MNLTTRMGFFIPPFARADSEQFRLTKVAKFFDTLSS